MVLTYCALSQRQRRKTSMHEKQQLCADIGTRDQTVPACTKTGRLSCRRPSTRTTTSLQRDQRRNDMFLDICRSTGQLDRFPHNAFQKAVREKSGVFRIPKTLSYFKLGEQIGKGSFGSIYRGGFADSKTRFAAAKSLSPVTSKMSFVTAFRHAPTPMEPIAIKVNRQGTVQGDTKELIIQAALFCDQRKFGAGAGSAQIPKPLFAVENRRQRYIGMQRLDQDLFTHLRSVPRAERLGELKKCLRPLCKTLIYLQDKFSFVHGDMHSGNIMVTLRPFKVYIIDFGFTSLNMFGSRVYMDAQYRGSVMNRSLDLLMLLTALRSQGLSDEVTAFCHKIIEPFYQLVARATDDDPRLGRVKRMLRHVKHQFHSLYGHAIDARYRRTYPKQVLEALDEI